MYKCIAASSTAGQRKGNKTLIVGRKHGGSIKKMKNNNKE